MITDTQKSRTVSAAPVITAETQTSHGGALTPPAGHGEVPPMEGIPQTEDGYTRIANELLDAITSFGLSKRHLKILLAVIRNTYGWNRKMAPCSLSWLAGKTGMATPHCSDGVTELVIMGLLKREWDGVQVLGINKHYNEWKGYQNGRGLPKQEQKGYQNGTKRVTKTVTIKDSKQKTGIKTKELSDPRVKTLGDLISNLYSGRHNKLPLREQGQMRRDVKNLLKTRTPEDIEKAYRAFLELADKYLKDHAWCKFQPWWASCVPNPNRK